MQDVLTDTVTELDIEALIDRQLNADDRKIVFRAMRRNPALRTKYIKLMQQKRLLARWWRAEHRH